MHLAKASTGIPGLDRLTNGGLPRGRVTLISGGAGTGKTILALETLFRGHGDGGIFVTFEESAEHLAENARSLAWFGGRQGRVHIVDAQLSESVVTTGDFDLNGLLATLDVHIARTGATWLVLDGIDVLLALLDDARAVRREIFRLRKWVLDRGLTALLTSKAIGIDDVGATGLPLVQYAVDCVIALDHGVRDRTAQRTLRVVKYRGSAHSSDEVPFSITSEGVTLAVPGATEFRHIVQFERVSSGVPKLDAMLGGGYWRGTAVLISGAPGTAKTTLAAATIAAALERGERALHVSFDESGAQIVRNVASVGVDLAPHVESGLLRMCSLRTRTSSAENHAEAIARLIAEHEPQVVVIDPISALAHVAGKRGAEDAAIQLVDDCKSRGVTLLATTLLGSMHDNGEGTPIGLSTLADTWIHLSYVSHGGERNRALSVVKSRGMKHSNQVRELVLDDRRIDLAAVYTAGGEVLMGALRWERERRAEQEQRDRHRELEAQRRDVERLLASIRRRADELERERERAETDLRRLESEVQEDRSRGRVEHAALHSLRAGDRGEEER